MTTARSMPTMMINQYGNQNLQDGDGILDWLKSKFAPVVNQPLRNPMINPPAIRKFLEIHGNEPVVSLKAKRVPVETAVQTLLNSVSLGALKSAVKSAGYDNIFHLSLVVNDKYELDKREVITQRPYQAKSNEELIDISLNGKTLTIREMLDNTIKYMGNRYGSYDPETNNCQAWVSGVLKGNGLGDEEDLKWINQDAVKIFQGLPNFAQRFAKFVSGKFAPFINKLIEGEGQQQQTPRQKLLKKMAEIEGKEYRPTRTKQEKRLMTDKITRQMMAKLNGEVLA